MCECVPQRNVIMGNLLYEQHEVARFYNSFKRFAVPLNELIQIKWNTIKYNIRWIIPGIWSYGINMLLLKCHTVFRELEWTRKAMQFADLFSCFPILCYPVHVLKWCHRLTCPGVCCQRYHEETWFLIIYVWHVWLQETVMTHCLASFYLIQLRKFTV